jgi:transposase
MRRLLEQLWQEWKNTEEQIQQLSDEIKSIACQDEACQGLLDVPGVGSLVATAGVASVGNGAAFRKGREFAAWLGLVPRQYSTGGKPKLLGISKRGNPYLRRLFIHGARSVAVHLNRDKHSLGPWMNQLESRAHHNVFVVALANKQALIAWAVLAKGKIYRPALAMQVGYV